MSPKKTAVIPVPQSARKHPTSYKLTDTALDIVSRLATKRGIAKSALIENLLRDAWQAEITRERLTASR